MRGLFGGRVPEPSGSLGGRFACRHHRALLWYTRPHFGKEAALVPSFVVYSSSFRERGGPCPLFCGILVLISGKRLPLSPLLWYTHPHFGKEAAPCKAARTACPLLWVYSSSLRALWGESTVMRGLFGGTLRVPKPEELFGGRVASQKGSLGGECRHARALWGDASRAVMRGLFGGRVPSREGFLGREYRDERALFLLGWRHERALWGESGVRRRLFYGRVP